MSQTWKFQKRKAPETPVTPEVVVAKKFKVDVGAVKALQTQLRFNEERLGTLGAPYLKNERSSVERTIAELKKKIEVLEDEPASKFSLALPYLVAQQELSDIKTMESHVFNQISASHFTRVLQHQCNIRDSLAPNTTIAGKYQEAVEGKAPAISILNKLSCPQCGHEYLFEPHLSMLICSNKNCSITDPFKDSTSTLTGYGEECEITSFSYKRKSRVDERLMFFQNKEGPSVPAEAIRIVYNHLKTKENYTLDNFKDLDVQKIFQVMKTLKLKKYYKHKCQIFCAITGIVPPRLSMKDKAMFSQHFERMQKPFEKHKINLNEDGESKSQRKNFLTYDTCLHRLTEMFGPKFWPFLIYFPLLKGELKMKKQNTLFKLICKDLNIPLHYFCMINRECTCPECLKNGNTGGPCCIGKTSAS